MKNKILSLVAILTAVLFANISMLNAQDFAIIGDYGTSSAANGPNAQKVADLVKFKDPQFILTLGDNNYPNGEQHTLCANITQYYYPFIDPDYTIENLENCDQPNYTGIDNFSTKFYPSPGNHDYNTPNAVPYYEYFDDIPNYYDFVKGDVHFFSLNSNQQEPDGTDENSIQADWLKNKLLNSTAKWKIVYFHHTVYTSGSHNGEPGEADRRWDYKEWGATAVISGHDHHYERLNVECLPYFVNGLGGITIRNVGDPIEGSEFIYNDKHGAMFITADANLIKFEFVAVSDDNPEGELIDTYIIDDLYPYTNCGETPVPENCCPEGSTWDYANCYFNINVPQGYAPFIWNNSFYTHYGPNGVGDCPPGTIDDGAHCSFNVGYSAQYDGFIWNNNFYTHENCEADPQLCCLPGTTWDGANCHYDNITIPDGYEPFIDSENELYLIPTTATGCPPGTTPTVAGCALGITLPEGIDGFTYKGAFYVHDNCDVDKCCPEGTVWNGEICTIELEWEDAFILNDNSIVLEYDDTKGCPDNTSLDATGEYCLTGLMVPTGFEGTVNGQVIEVEPNCNSCCPEGYEFNGVECEKVVSLDGAFIYIKDGERAIRPDCSSFSISNNCCPEGLYYEEGHCFLRESTQENTFELWGNYVFLSTPGISCLDDSERMKREIPEMRIANDTNEDKPSIVLYPNPSKDKFFFEFDSSSDPLIKVAIHDSVGNLIYVLSKTQISSSKIELSKELKSGLYIVTFEFEQEIITKKIMKF